MNFKNYDTIILNGVELSGTGIADYCRETGDPFLLQIGLFVNEWLDQNPFIEVNTSGSTGKPKQILIEKNRMLQSAAMTANYFQFKKPQTALLCLPVDYIAGKMMIVRAFFSQLDLICTQPSSNPFAELDKKHIDFAPLIPMQLQEVTSTDIIRKILLGGAPLNPVLEERIQTFSSDIFQGYGMTETLSHVAIRRVNGSGKSNVYNALEGIYFETDHLDCLVIHAPFLNKAVTTNDVVELLNDHSFLWKGRRDYVINSGGIKLFPEEIEKKLFSFIKEQFFIAGIPDTKFGEKVHLFIESEPYEKNKLSALNEKMIDGLEQYEKPRDIIFLKKFVYTENGKINRKETISKAIEKV